MNNVFNTTFENSLRILLLLSIAEKPQTADMLSALDFITMYGQSFGLTEKNLHGENPYNFSEYASRREFVAVALKQLVLKGLVILSNETNGYCYVISESGRSVVVQLDTAYAAEYLACIRVVMSYAKVRTEQQLLSRIYECGAYAVKHGGDNE
jgi:hypothetical protein